MESERASAGPVTLRHELRPGDVADVVRLHGEIYGREHGFDATFEGYVERHLRAFATAGAGRMWIAERGGEIVGSIAIVDRHEHDPDATEVQLRWFLVVPSARGAGLGRRLMDTALSYCRECRHATVFLWTVDLLAAAARLYTTVGFELAEEAPARMGGVHVIEQRYVCRLG